MTCFRSPSPSPPESVTDLTALFAVDSSSTALRFLLSAASALGGDIRDGIGGDAELLAFGGDEVHAVVETGGIDKVSCDQGLLLDKAGRDVAITIGVVSRLEERGSMLVLVIDADAGVSPTTDIFIGDSADKRL